MASSNFCRTAGGQFRLRKERQYHIYWFLAAFLDTSGSSAGSAGGGLLPEGWLGGLPAANALGGLGGLPAVGGLGGLAGVGLGGLPLGGLAGVGLGGLPLGGLAGVGLGGLPLGGLAGAGGLGGLLLGGLAGVGLVGDGAAAWAWLKVEQGGQRQWQHQASQSVLSALWVWLAALLRSQLRVPSLHH